MASPRRWTEWPADLEAAGTALENHRGIVPKSLGVQESGGRRISGTVRKMIPLRIKLFTEHFRVILLTNTISSFSFYCNFLGTKE